MQLNQYTLNKKTVYNVLQLLIASVWLINGLICKVLSVVPRHKQIVGRILGEDFAEPLTTLIGISEIVMAIWILSRFKTKFNAIAQIGIIATMNILELLMVPDLLLWGKANAIFALMLIAVIFYKEFVLSKNVAK